MESGPKRCGRCVLKISPGATESGWAPRQRRWLQVVVLICSDEDSFSTGGVEIVGRKEGSRLRWKGEVLSD